jgi:hypothetical protein
MRYLLLACLLAVPAAALAFELPKSLPKVPDSMKKAVGDEAKKQAKDEANKALGVITHEEQIALCSEELPHEAECKMEWCTAMVDVRTLSDPKFKNFKGDAKKIGDMHAACLKEIVQDAASDASARQKNCERFSKERGDLPITKTMADQMKACWTKGSCAEKVACWKPKFATAMAGAQTESGNLKVPGTK